MGRDHDAPGLNQYADTKQKRRRGKRLPICSMICNHACMSVLKQIAVGLGETPKQIANRTTRLSRVDAERVLMLPPSAYADNKTPKIEQNEIWPLISHHGFNRASIFNHGGHGGIQQKALSFLLVHDGLVISNPLIDIKAIWDSGNRNQAATALDVVIRQIAEVEPLIEAGHLRFISSRPAFTDRARQSILDLFGIDTNLTVFANFEQAFFDVSPLNEKYYLEQIGDLYYRMGLKPPKPNSAEEGRKAIARLARALIYVSWQISSCAQTSSCDLTLTTGLEHELFDEALNRATNKKAASSANNARARTRHVKRLAIGAVPNLDSTELSIADAIALRKNDAFANFRDELKIAMNALPLSSVNGWAKSESEIVFEERMLQSVKELQAKTKKSSFKDRLKDSAMPMALGVASGAAWNAPTGITPTILAGATSIAGNTIYQWLKGRSEIQSDQIVVRYFSSLGGQAGQIK